MHSQLQGYSQPTIHYSTVSFTQISAAFRTLTLPLCWQVTPSDSACQPSPAWPSWHHPTCNTCAVLQCNHPTLWLHSPALLFFRQPGEEIQRGPNWDLSKALNNGYRPLLLTIGGYPGHFGFLLIKIRISHTISCHDTPFPYVGGPPRSGSQPLPEAVYRPKKLSRVFSQLI